MVTHLRRVQHDVPSADSTSAQIRAGEGRHEGPASRPCFRSRSLTALPGRVSGAGSSSRSLALANRASRPYLVPGMDNVLVAGGVGGAGNQEGPGSVLPATGSSAAAEMKHSAECVCRVRPLQRGDERPGHGPSDSGQTPFLRVIRHRGGQPATSRLPRPHPSDHGAGRAARQAAPQPLPRRWASALRTGPCRR